MRRIGGVNMNTVARMTKKQTNDKKEKRYCTVYESLDESLKEVKLIKEGKIKAKSWDELYEELKSNKE